MRYLYIDTSSNFLYSAIIEDEKLLVEIKEKLEQELSKLALPRIAEMFDKVNLKAKDIDKIIVVNGPGSFTGIRIGLTIAKVYAWSLNIPITQITSLEAMSASSNEKKYHVPIINARKGYVYGAIYDENQNEILKPTYIELSELELKIKNISDYEIIKNDESLEGTNNYDPNFLKIISHFKNKENTSPHLINPEYLKLTEAEKSKL